MDEIQSAVCQRFGAECCPSQPYLKVGLAVSTLEQQPINGLRHPPAGDTSGWYIWGGGEPSSADDFFEPVHVEHLAEIVPAIIPYLGLPAGWRVQLAPGHEDVWFDATLLDVS